jgi:hypothetical protein
LKRDAVIVYFVPKVALVITLSGNFTRQQNQTISMHGSHDDKFNDDIAKRICLWWLTTI